jgi:hypothetical protein
MKKLIFILLLVTISLYAHHPGHEEEHKQKEEIYFDQKDLHFHSSINEKPTVGKLSNLFGILKSKNNIFPVLYKIEVQNIEHEETVFRAQTISLDGNLNWKYQFFDGSPHKIFVSLFDHQNHLIVSDFFIKEVEAVEPPLFSIVRSMLLLLLITFSGMVLGYFLSFLIWKNRIIDENSNNQ